MWVSDPEIRRLADALDISVEAFGKRYLRRARGRLALTDRADGACIFWDDGCTVYSARPDQCASFPFWKENLARASDWKQTASECEGIGEGPVYSAEDVDRLLRGETRTLPAPAPARGDEQV